MSERANTRLRTDLQAVERLHARLAPFLRCTSVSPSSRRWRSWFPAARERSHDVLTKLHLLLQEDIFMKNGIRNFAVLSLAVALATTAAFGASAPPASFPILGGPRLP